MLTLPRYQPHRLQASRLLAVTGVANALCFALANIAQIPVQLTPLLYALCLIAGWQLFFPLTIASQSLRPTRLLWALTLAFILALLLPRLIYPIEWLHGQQSEAVFDDYARIAELASMTLSAKYPLLHPASDQFLLSFYYAAFYPMAAIKLLVPLLTIKDSLFLGSLFYAPLLGLSLMEVALRCNRTQRGALLLLFLCTWFGGLDWLTNPLQPIYSHSEWWALKLFERPSQISGFLTASQWSVHHFLGFYLALLAWVLLRFSRGQRRWQKQLGIPLLLTAALFHSPFGFLPVVLLGLPWLRLLVRRYLLRWTGLVCVLVLVAPLPVFFNRLPGNTLQWRMPLFDGASGSLTDHLLAALAYIIALPLIDLAALPMLVCWFWPRLKRLERQLALASLTFFLITLFLYMPLFNNFSMRGMLLPSFVCFLLVARYSETITKSTVTYTLALVVLALAAVGGAREFTSQARYALWADSQARQHWLGEPPLPTWYEDYYAIARDSSVRVLPADSPNYRARRPYLAEKRLPNVSQGKFNNMERELAALPRTAQDKR